MPSAHESNRRTITSIKISNSPGEKGLVLRGGPRFIAIVGAKKTGKTTLATFLVQRLVRRGYRVVSMKHVHHRNFSLDSPGRDSWRLTKAGSRAVVIISPDEITQIIRPERGSNREGLAFAVKTALSIRSNFIVLEGFSSMLRAFPHPLLTIVMANSEEDLSRSMARVRRSVFAISGRIADNTTEPRRNGIPILKYPADRERLFRGIAKWAGL